MATLTIRLPDEKQRRLKALARYRRISVNKLMEELSTQALAEFDTEVRFRALAASGDLDRGLALLDKIDATFSGAAQAEEGGKPRRLG